MESRRRLPGYEFRSAELRIAAGEGGYSLKNAPLGLVETFEEATRLLAHLCEQMPEHNWRFEQRSFPEVESVNWNN